MRGQRGIYLHCAMGHVLVPSGTLLSWCPPWGVDSMPSLPSKSAQFVAQKSISRFPLQGFAGVQRAQGRSFPINSSSGSFMPARKGLGAEVEMAALPQELLVCALVQQ